MIFGAAVCINIIIEFHQSGAGDAKWWDCQSEIELPCLRFWVKNQAVFGVRRINNHPGLGVPYTQLSVGRD